MRKLLLENDFFLKISSRFAFFYKTVKPATNAHLKKKKDFAKLMKLEKN